ncbi:MAG: polyprenol monophosphomannose synthase [Cyclobacteriaceae bacterium]|nr:polyprenol monophosphomannose synthase [Cyclobacteriaceae bacterium]
MNNAIVIIPTYNEMENITMLIDTVFSLPKDFDILIVDDNSPDGTATLVQQLQSNYNTAHDTRLHLLQRPGKQGLGTAYIQGFKYALQQGYDFILQMDADFSHNPKDLVPLYLNCSEWGSDLAIGSRYATGVNVVNWPMGRVLLSFFASKYVQVVTGIPVHDTTAGFVCYRKKVLETIPLDEVRFVGYAFQIEMKFLTWKYGFKLTEVPIVFTDRTRGQSKLSVGIFKEAFLGVMQMTIKSWFKKYIPAT